MFYHGCRGRRFMWLDLIAGNTSHGATCCSKAITLQFFFASYATDYNILWNINMVFLLFHPVPLFPSHSSFPQMWFLLCQSKFHRYHLFVSLWCHIFWKTLCFFIERSLCPVWKITLYSHLHTSVWGCRQTTEKVRHRQTLTAQNMWSNLGQLPRNSSHWQHWLGVWYQLI